MPKLMTTLKENLRIWTMKRQANWSCWLVTLNVKGKLWEHCLTNFSHILYMCHGVLIGKHILVSINMLSYFLCSIHRLSSFKGSKMRLHMDSQPVPTPMDIESPSQYQYQNFQSRSRLDARLWLDCRLALVKCLMGRVRGMSLVESRYFRGEGNEIS